LTKQNIKPLFWKTTSTRESNSQRNQLAKATSSHTKHMTRSTVAFAS